MDVTVNLDNGTSHTFDVRDPLRVVENFELALKGGHVSIRVGPNAVFATVKVNFVCVGRPQP